MRINPKARAHPTTNEPEVREELPSNFKLPPLARLQQILLRPILPEPPLAKDPVGLSEGAQGNLQAERSETARERVDFLRTNLRVIRAISQVRPDLFWKRLATSGAVSGALVLSAYTFGRFVGELSKYHSGTAPLDSVISSVGTVMCAGASLLLLRNHQERLAASHDAEIEQFTARELMQTAASVPPDDLENREIANDLNEVKRNEYSIRDTSKETFNVVQHGISAVVATAAIAAREPMIALAAVVLPASLGLFSQLRQAMRTEDARVHNASNDRVLAYLRQTALNPVGLQTLQSAGKTGEFVQKVMNRVTMGVLGRFSVTTRSISDTARSSLIFEGATYGALLYAAVSLPLRDTVFMWGLIASSRASLLQVNASFGRIVQSVNIIGTLYRLQDHLASKQDLRPRVTLTEPPEIIFRDILFRYSGKKSPALTIPGELKIPASKRTVFVGPSGAGKTTALNLLLGFYLPEEGEIIVGGSRTRDSIVQTASIAQKDETFLGLTYEEVILLGHIDGAGRSVEEAAAISGFDEVCKDKPHGLKTRNGPFKDGSGLSGGQLQKLSLARLFASPARLKTADEPTASLDVDSVTAIASALQAERAHATTIEVTHSMSAASTADLIIVFENGTVTACGSHEELMKNPDGWYYRAFSEQARHYQRE